MINASQIHIRKTQYAIIKPTIYYVSADTALGIAQMGQHMFIKPENSSSLDKLFALFSDVGHIGKQCDAYFLFFKEDAFLC